MSELKATVDSYCSTLGAPLTVSDIEAIGRDLTNYWVISIDKYHRRWNAKVYPDFHP